MAKITLEIEFTEKENAKRFESVEKLKEEVLKIDGVTNVTYVSRGLFLYNNWVCRIMHSRQPPF